MIPGLVDIVVPVVVTAVVIIIALLAYLLYKRKQPRPPISQLPRYEGNFAFKVLKQLFACYFLKLSWEANSWTDA